MKISFDWASDTCQSTKDGVHSMKKTSIKREKFFVAGVCCATDEAQVRKRLDTLIGPESYNFNSVTCNLSIHVDVDGHNVIKHLREAGFVARRKSELQEEVTFWQRHKDTITTVAATIFAALGLALEQLDGSVVASKSLLLVAIILGGWKVFIKGFKAAKSLSLDMNFLMSIAVIGAMLIGRWGEGAAVIVLFALSLALESYGASRTRRAIQSLMNLSPNQGSVLKDGKEVRPFIDVKEQLIDIDTFGCIEQGFMAGWFVGIVSASPDGLPVANLDESVLASADPGADGLEAFIQRVS